MNSKDLPEVILPELLWSIAQPVPPDMEAFRAALGVYASKIGVEQDFSEFDQVLPGHSVDIQYSYSVQKDSGEWEDVEQVVRVRSDRPISQGELVWRLHQAAHRHLVDQDHHFFEGLYLMDGSYEDDIPVYELVTGS